MNKKTNRLTILLAAVSVVLCVAVMGTGMALAQNAGEDLVESLAKETPTAPAKQAERRMIVVTKPYTVPSEAISPQLAVSIGEEVVEKAFGKTLETRILVSYELNLSENRQLWSVQAETLDCYVSFDVDALSGAFVSCRDEADFVEEWRSQFDSITQEKENAKRAKDEDRIRIAERWQDQLDGKEEVYSQETLDAWAAETEYKLNDIKAAIETNKDSAFAATATDWVNERSAVFFNGAKAVRAVVLGNGNEWSEDEQEPEKVKRVSDDGEESYVLIGPPQFVISEVQLDNGTYVNLHINRKTGAAVFYQPLGTTSLTEYWYGVKLDR
ncbi:MAG: hypothetical protein LBS36_08635 [Oscillospiraceae bacterium]|jgi:hypothetical protein|nr:hypothetical protein [Oscillospiraceae bacterium]